MVPKGKKEVRDSSMFYLKKKKQSFPLWASVQMDVTGWNWSALDIGVAMAAGSLGQIVMQLVLFNPLFKKLGLMVMYQIFYLIAVVVFCTWFLLVNQLKKKKKT